MAGPVRDRYASQAPNTTGSTASQPRDSPAELRRINSPSRRSHKRARSRKDSGRRQADATARAVRAATRKGGSWFLDRDGLETSARHDECKF